MAPIGAISVAMIVTRVKIEVMIMVKIGVTEVLLMEDMDLVLKRSETLPLAIWEKLLTVIGEVGIGPRPATLPPITQMIILDC